MGKKVERRDYKRGKNRGVVKFGIGMVCVMGCSDAMIPLCDVFSSVGCGYEMACVCPIS